MITRIRGRKWTLGWITLCVTFSAICDATGWQPLA